MNGCDYAAYQGQILLVVLSHTPTVEMSPTPIHFLWAGGGRQEGTEEL